MEIKSGEFIKRVRKYARKNGLAFSYDPAHGKGSHGRLNLEGRFCTIVGEDKMIRPGLLHALCKQLGISLKDL
jgi:hypothetical protein